MVYTSPNLSELDAMLGTLPGGSQHLPKITPTSEDSLVLHVANEAVKLITHYGISVLLVTMSEAGVLIVRQGLPDAPLPLAGRVDPLLDSPVSAVWYKGQPCPSNSLVSVSGAGGVSTLVNGWNDITSPNRGLSCRWIHCCRPQGSQTGRCRGCWTSGNHFMLNKQQQIQLPKFVPTLFSL